MDIVEKPALLVAIGNPIEEHKVIEVTDDMDVEAVINEFLGDGKSINRPVHEELRSFSVYQTVALKARQVHLTSSKERQAELEMMVAALNEEGMLLKQLVELGVMPAPDENGCMCGQCGKDETETVMQ